MANKTGYMDKERATSEKYQREHLAWLKDAQAKSSEIHKKFIASNREYAKTLGKFDDYRGQVRKMKY